MTAMHPASIRKSFFFFIFEKIARKIERTGSLPETMTLAGCPSEYWWHLNELFRANVKSLPDGRVRVRFEGEIARPQYWLTCFEKEGFKSSRKIAIEMTRREQSAQMLQRIELQYPDAHSVLMRIRSALASNSSVMDWPGASELLKGILDRFMYPPANPKPVTLSQLGSDILNDSKALRDGRGRALLRIALGALECEPEADERELFRNYGIVENSYTTFVLCHVPFEFELGSEKFDFPRRMFERGMAVTLPLEMVERMENITLIDVDTILTSENAAPFHRMVEAREKCVYTEGYPNTAVKRLLASFARHGARAIHCGDTDLDGYRIASEVGRVIDVTLPSLSDDLPRKSLTLNARCRLEVFIKAHPDFVYLSELRDTLASGWVEQEKRVEGLKG